MTETGATGTLYIVATPIGNQDDISRRALKILEQVDLILAEDTRHSLPLLNALGIKNKLQSFHAHNEEEKSKQIIQELLKGESIALISDAGTPLISDPGFPLVHLAQQNNITVIPIPGACALIAALSAAGVPCDSFLFLGFLPAKSQARQNKLNEVRSLPYTLVFYESTHRILAAVDDLACCYGNECQIVLVKELTKTFERFISGSITEVKAWLNAEAAHTKGEFVLIVPPRASENNNEKEEILGILLEELPLKQAVSLTSKITSINKNELYDLALKIKK